MKKITDAVKATQDEFREVILASEIAAKGLEKDQYIRYLQMQYHLVRDVQKNFFEIAAHPDIFLKRKFSKFLVGFGIDEAPHYKMAEKDLSHLDAGVGEIPFDVELWWTYFSKAIKEKPLQRIGGTCVLENIGTAVGDLIDTAISKSPYLNQKNTTFLILHKHEVVNHGDEIIEAVTEANLNVAEEQDVLQGIEHAKTLFFRMFHWVLTGKELY